MQERCGQTPVRLPASLRGCVTHISVLTWDSDVDPETLPGSDTNRPLALSSYRAPLLMT